MFGAESYTFTVTADAVADAAVGSVSATDDSGNPVTYAVTAGNEAGLFAISSGAVTVAVDLSGQAETTVTLTVEATDGTTTTTVAVEITIAG